ncbi:TPA: hypothetical protein DDW35_11590 [Candidatus Sumerlaeota bacterium]|jgi:hypothetical protein|nr:hypothetical protein [Candidatus Sumerlaeota bacterium]
MTLCLVVADADGKHGEKLQIRQVIESLVYQYTNKSVSVMFDVFLHNDRDKPCSLLLVHRGLCECELKKTSLLSDQYENPSEWGDGKVDRIKVLRAIYNDRIVKENGYGFYERQDYYSLQKEATSPIVPCCPNLKEDLFIDEKNGWPTDVFPPFSAFQVGPFQPGDSWFRVEMKISGLSYEYLVENPVYFWVDGPDRVKREIETADIPLRGYMSPKYQTVFDERISTHILDPKNYDVVVHRLGTNLVDTDVCCSPCSGDEYLASIAHPEVSKRAYHFTTRSSAFWIDMHYVNDSRIVQNESVCASLVGVA